MRNLRKKVLVPGIPFSSIWLEQIFLAILFLLPKQYKGTI